jgi:trans-4-hydroxy-L-proline dehydratase
MNKRIKTLRTQSLEAKPTISAERAILVTEFYKKPEIRSLSTPMQRALVFKYIMENKSIVINEGELIVGERGPAPKATPTYPEVCIHSLQDLQFLNDRKKTPFYSDKKTRQIYADEMIPFWKGSSQRDRIFAAMSKDWLDAYEAGIFTEFMEQRAPGHTVLDDKIYRKGMNDFKKDIEASLVALDLINDPSAYEKQEELKAMAICADAIIAFARRHADKARELAKKETDKIRKLELKRIAEVCDNVPANAPRNFWEALQAYWFVHLGVITEYNTWDSFNPGRLDQHLLPFYRKDLASGTMTKKTAIELLQVFWIKFNNQPAPPKVGVTAEESGTYTDFALINLGA